MTESDYDYFRRRAVEERAAAKRAIDPLARRAHLELARRYENVAEAVDGAIVQLHSSERLPLR